MKVHYYSLSRKMPTDYLKSTGPPTWLKLQKTGNFQTEISLFTTRQYYICQVKLSFLTIKKSFLQNTTLIVEEHLCSTYSLSLIMPSLYSFFYSPPSDSSYHIHNVSLWKTKTGDNYQILPYLCTYFYLCNFPVAWGTKNTQLLTIWGTGTSSCVPEGAWIAKSVSPGKQLQMSSWLT